VKGSKLILKLHNNQILLFQKNKLDLLNWAKSQLKEGEQPKLGKRMSPYRGDKITSLSKVIKWLNGDYTK